MFGNFPLELNITHQPRVVPPQSQEYEDLVNMEVGSEFDFSENVNEEDSPDDALSPIETPLSMLTNNLNPESVDPSLDDEIPHHNDPEPPKVEPTRFSGRGRRIIPRTGFEDYVMDYVFKLPFTF